MEKLYSQISKYEKKKAVSTNIISSIMLILGLTGLIMSLSIKIVLLGILAGVITVFCTADLLITNISISKTIKKLKKDAPILKEGIINKIEDGVIIAVNDIGMEYEITPVTNHKFNTGDKIFFLGVNEFLGMSCTYVRYAFYNGCLL